MAGQPEVTIIDYGMGNLRSVEKAFSAVGARPALTKDPRRIRESPRLVLPGVGAFGDAMRNLEDSGLQAAIIDSVRDGTPLLGLCLGLQLLFEESEEFGVHRGLGVIPGRVRRFGGPGIRVPHVGWNQVEGLQPDPLLEGIAEGTYFYFVHSFYVEPAQAESALGWTDYGLRFCSLARHGHAWGAQFHPEKSQDAGKRLLRNFLGIGVARTDHV